MFLYIGTFMYHILAHFYILASYHFYIHQFYSIFNNTFTYNSHDHNNDQSSSLD